MICQLNSCSQKYYRSSCHTRSCCLKWFCKPCPGGIWTSGHLFVVTPWSCPDNGNDVPNTHPLCCLPFAHPAKQRPAVHCLTIRRAVAVSPHTGPQEVPETTEVIWELFVQTPPCKSTCTAPSATTFSCLRQSEKSTKTYSLQNRGMSLECLSLNFWLQKGHFSLREQQKFEFKFWVQNFSLSTLHDAHAHICPLYRRFPIYCRDVNVSFGFNFSPSPHWIPKPSHLPCVQKGGGFVCFF